MVVYPRKNLVLGVQPDGSELLPEMKKFLEKNKEHVVLEEIRFGTTFKYYRLRGSGFWFSQNFFRQNSAKLG